MLLYVHVRIFRLQIYEIKREHELRFLIFNNIYAHLPCVFRLNLKNNSFI